MGGRTMKDERTKSKVYERAAMEAERLANWTGDALSLTLQYLRLLNELAELEEELAGEVYVSKRRALRRKIDELNEVLAAWSDVLSSLG